MNRIRVRSLHFAGVLLAITFIACNDSSAPRPVNDAAEDQADGLRPMSSRDAAPPAHGAAPATGETAPGDEKALPPGHPPIGSMPPHGTGAGAAGDSAGAVTGTVQLAPPVTGRAQPTDVLYLIARKDGGVVAVRRIESPTFPLSFEISGADAMMAGTKFEGPLEIVARLSHTGDAIAAAGDLEGATKDVKVPATGVTLTIDTVRQ